MANKFGKFLLTTAALGAVAAGAYVYLKRENDVKNVKDLKDEFKHDVDSFFENKKIREYVSLNKTTPEEKEVLEDAVSEAAEATEGTEDLGIVRDESQEAADFAFKEFKDDEKPLAE